MAALSIPIFLKTLALLVFHFQILSADPSSSFSFQGYFKGSTFESNIALYGDAKPAEDGSMVLLTQPVGPSAGRVMYKKPIKLIGGNLSRGNLVSFSTYFSFSMSPDTGDGLAFLMVPSGFNASVFGDSRFGFSLESEKSNPSILAIEFDTLKDAKYGDLDEKYVGIDVGGFASVKSRNFSFGSVGLNSGKKLHAWIDYEASYKRLEVRLSESGDTKPVDPLLSYPIDLPKMWNDESVLLGLSSYNGNSSQRCFLYSWSFKLRIFPQWMHSEPADPKNFAKNEKQVIVRKRSYCVLRVLAAMIIGTACGVLGALMVLYLWTIFGNRRPVVPMAPEECPTHSVGCEYKKVKVVVDKALEEDGKQ